MLRYTLKASLRLVGMWLVVATRQRQNNDWLSLKRVAFLWGREFRVKRGSDFSATARGCSGYAQ